MPPKGRCRRPSSWFQGAQAGPAPIVVINKIDRPDERHEHGAQRDLRLFAALDASDEQLDFPVLYGSGRDGWMAADPKGPKADVTSLFELVVAHMPPPTVEEGPFRLLATTLEANPYLGPHPHWPHLGQRQAEPNHQGHRSRGVPIETARVTKVLAFRGLEPPA